MRKYYVGMTRAKRNLFIHTNSDCFKQLTSAKYIVDQQQYNMPDEIVLQLSYKDVYLNYFRERKHDILTLKSGDELYYKDSFLFCQPSHNPVVKLSRSMQDKLYDWDKKGYKVKAASVRFIVAWKPKDAPTKEADTAVILADIKLSRQPQQM